MGTSTSQNSDGSQKRVYAASSHSASRRADGGVISGEDAEVIAQMAEDERAARGRKIKAGMTTEMIRLKVAPITPSNRPKS